MTTENIYDAAGNIIGQKINDRIIWNSTYQHALAGSDTPIIDSLTNVGRNTNGRLDREKSLTEMFGLGFRRRDLEYESP